MATSKAWVRLHDWAAVVIGVLAALAPLVIETTTGALWTLVIFGALLALAGLWSLAMPGSVASEYVHIGLGVLLFISPWVMGFTDLTGAMWTAWVAGALAVLVGAAAVPVATTTHRGLAGSH
ncbi:MAG: SPW repeat domain-containing protein [Pseudonocardiaceae bacterium]